MSMTRHASASGPVVQSFAIGFRGLVLATCVLAVAWAASNIRAVPPTEQAVISRFGAIVRVVRSGLVIALPRPIGAVTLLPGPERQMELKVIGGGANVGALVDRAAARQTPPASSSPFLTGDGGVVVLDTTLTWRVVDAAAYLLAQDHVPAALRRIYLATATEVAATRRLDDFLVARTGGEEAQTGRETLRGALVNGINTRLASMRAAGADIGIEVTRCDVEALLPPSAKIAFDQVLGATQMAEQSIAAARTEATRATQAAERTHDQILTEARASAAERISEARSQVAVVSALATQVADSNRGDILDLLYRQRIAEVLHRAGSVTTVDPAGGEHLILPAGPTTGAKP
jgi:regulator of protease activity HflC (stomatin/prohibitin superfamily)